MEHQKKIDSLETLKVLSDPLRIQLVAAIRARNEQAELATVKYLAERFDRSPKKLYYHINLLEKHQLIEVADTRLVSGIVEKDIIAASDHIERDGLRCGEGDRSLEIIRRPRLEKEVGPPPDFEAGEVPERDVLKELGSHVFTKMSPEISVFLHGAIIFYRRSLGKISVFGPRRGARSIRKRCSLA